MLDKHRAASPSLSPIGASPDLIASMIMPMVENSAMSSDGGARTESKLSDKHNSIQADNEEDQI